MLPAVSSQPAGSQPACQPAPPGAAGGHRLSEDAAPLRVTYVLLWSSACDQISQRLSHYTDGQSGPKTWHNSAPWGYFESADRSQIRKRRADPSRLTLRNLSDNLATYIPPVLRFVLKDLDSCFFPPTHFLFECLSIDYKVVIF